MAGKAIDAAYIADFDAGVWALYPPDPGGKALRIAVIPFDTGAYFATREPFNTQLEKLAVYVTSRAGQALIAELMPPDLAGLLFICHVTYLPGSARNLIAQQHSGDKLIGVAATLDGSTVHGVYDLPGDSFTFCEPDDLGNLNLEPVMELLYAIDTMLPVMSDPGQVRAAFEFHLAEHCLRRSPPELASYRFLPDTAVGGRDPRLGGHYGPHS